MTRFNVIMYSEQDSWLADKLSIRLKIEIIVRKSQYLPSILNIIGLTYMVLHLIWLICNRDCLECLVPIAIKHCWIVILTSTKHRPGVWAFIVGRSSLRVCWHLLYCVTGSVQQILHYIVYLLVCSVALYLLL